MLPRAHRVTRGDDYKSIVRRGVRVGARGLTVSVLARERTAPERTPGGSAAAPTRFGFIISKRVGVAVVRNRLRRRLKHISRELLASLPEGLDVVYRVHPEAADLPFDELRERAVFGVRRCLKRLGVEARPAAAASEAPPPGSAPRARARAAADDAAGSSSPDAGGAPPSSAAPARDAPSRAARAAEA